MEQLITTPMHVGQILKARRKRCGLTQGALAERLGIKQKRISELEANPEKLTVERLFAIANLLNFEVTIRERAENFIRMASDR